LFTGAKLPRTQEKRIPTYYKGVFHPVKQSHA